MPATMLPSRSFLLTLALFCPSSGLLIRQSGEGSDYCYVKKGNLTHPSTNTYAVKALIQHKPLLKPKDLVEYKNAAEDCLSFCTGLQKKCFRDCLDTCTKALGPPQCVGFAMEKECNDACNGLTAPYKCLLTVKLDSTAECQEKFGKAKVPNPDKTACKLP